MFRDGRCEGKVGLQKLFSLFEQRKAKPLAPVMVDAVEENLEEPGAAIGAGLEAVERLPGLQVDFLNDVFRARALAQNAGGRAKDIGHVGHGLVFESLGVERKIWHAANGRATSKSDGTVRYYPATDCNGRMHVCVMPTGPAFIPGRDEGTKRTRELLILLRFVVSRIPPLRSRFCLDRRSFPWVDSD